MQLRSRYDNYADEQSKADDSNAGHSFARVGLLFGSLAFALLLVLVPVYMKRSNSGLMDSQYTAAPQSSALTAVGAHGSGE